MVTTIEAKQDENVTSGEMKIKAHDPLWTLLFLFEAIMMAPPSSEERTEDRGNYKRCLSNRIDHFKSGHIEYLYNNAWSVLSTPPKDRGNSDDLSAKIRRANQAAKDENFSLSLRRLHSLPMAKNTEGNIKLLKQNQE